MATNLYLTDEDSGLPGYKLARVGLRSECPSLVRSVTATATGPSSGIQVTRSSGGTALAWITEPLTAVSVTAATWVAHLWAKESDAAANASLRVQVYQWTVAEAGTALLDSNPGTELGTTTANIARTTGAATLTALAAGDRLVVKLLVDDAASSLVTGHTVTLAYNGQEPRIEGDSYLVCQDALTVLGQWPLTTEDVVRQALWEHRQDSGEAPPIVEPAHIISAFTAALGIYSRDRPRRLVASVSGDGSAYDFPLPRGWVYGLSRLVSIEYPAGEQTPTMLTTEATTIRESVLGGQPVRVLRFLGITPESGTDNILVTYTARHVHSSEADSIPADDLPAVCWLAAAQIADGLAADKAASSDSTINADTTNHRDGEQRWASVARRLRERYAEHLGLRGPVAAASAIKNLNPSAQFGDRLVHPAWRR